MKINKILSLLLVCFMLPLAAILVACDNKTPSSNIKTWDGSVGQLPKTENGTIYINTAEQLASIAKTVNSGETLLGITIKLTTDIDLKNNEWTPIGYGSGSDETYARVFCGIFDGQGHTIYNLKVTEFVGGEERNLEAATGIGLFGNIGNSAVVKNLILEKAKVNGNRFVGALVGYASQSTIENCKVNNVRVRCERSDKEYAKGDNAAAIVGGFLNSSASDLMATNSFVYAGSDAGQVFGSIMDLATYEVETCTAVNVLVLNNDTGSGENITINIVGVDKR